MREKITPLPLLPCHLPFLLLMQTLSSASSPHPPFPAIVSLSSPFHLLLYLVFSFSFLCPLPPLPCQLAFFYLCRPSSPPLPSSSLPCYFVTSAYADPFPHALPPPLPCQIAFFYLYQPCPLLALSPQSHPFLLPFILPFLLFPHLSFSKCRPALSSPPLHKSSPLSPLFSHVQGCVKKSGAKPRTSGALGSAAFSLLRFFYFFIFLTFHHLQKNIFKHFYICRTLRNYALSLHACM